MVLLYILDGMHFMIIFPDFFFNFPVSFSFFLSSHSSLSHFSVHPGWPHVAHTCKYYFNITKLYACESVYRFNSFHISNMQTNFLKCNSIHRMEFSYFKCQSCVWADVISKTQFSSTETSSSNDEQIPFFNQNLHAMTVFADKIFWFIFH